MAKPFGKHHRYETIPFMANNRVDVAIVGASVSGAVAAWILGKAGVKVALIDAQCFPRRKACGEGLSAIGKQYLEGLGLWSRELDAAAYPFYNYDIQFRDGKSICLKNNRSMAVPEGYGISRTILDTSLLQAVRTLPSVSYSNSRLLNLHHHPSFWELECSNRDICAEQIIMACGRQAANFLPQVEYRNFQHERWAIVLWGEGHWAGQLPVSVYIHHEPEGQYLITPLSATSANFSVLLSMAYQKRITKYEICQKACAFAKSRGFELGASSELIGASQIHSLRLKNRIDNAYLIGDSVERFDPIGGMGMTHAIYSASVAAINFMRHAQNKELATFCYYKEREVGARFMRLVSLSSYALNVGGPNWAKHFTRLSPGIAFGLQSFIKGFFPVAPLSI